MNKLLLVLIGLATCNFCYSQTAFYSAQSIYGGFIVSTNASSISNPPPSCTTVQYYYTNSDTAVGDFQYARLGATFVFTNASSSNICRMSLVLRRTGNPGTVAITNLIYTTTTNGVSPLRTPDQLVATSTTVLTSVDTTNTRYYFDFPTTGLAVNKQYFVVLWNPSRMTATDTVYWVMSPSTGVDYQDSYWNAWEATAVRSPNMELFSQ